MVRDGKLVPQINVNFINDYSFLKTLKWKEDIDYGKNKDERGNDGTKR